MGFFKRQCLHIHYYSMDWAQQPTDPEQVAKQESTILEHNQQSRWVDVWLLVAIHNPENPLPHQINKLNLQKNL